MSDHLEIADIDLGIIAKIALKAGAMVMEIYSRDDFSIEYKGDQSPLTLADRQSHTRIVQELQKHYKNIPILSEEGSEITYSERRNWDMFWLIDPLDGTKEFINRNGEFTINIALIKNSLPVLGIVYGPALDTLYAARTGTGAYKVDQAATRQINSEADIIKHGRTLPIVKNEGVIRVVVSRSHSSKETEAFIADLKTKHPRVETVSSGSSLKLCAVADGTADYYPRFGPTMEWDTAAGQAIVTEAGGTVCTANGSEPFVYNKQSLRNPGFIVKSGTSSFE